MSRGVALLLLPQPGGIDGFDLAVEPLEAGGPPVANGPYSEAPGVKLMKPLLPQPGGIGHL